MAHRAEGPNSLSMAGWTDLIIDLAKNTKSKINRGENELSEKLNSLFNMAFWAALSNANGASEYKTEEETAQKERNCEDTEKIFKELWTSKRKADELRIQIERQKLNQHWSDPLNTEEVFDSLVSLEEQLKSVVQAKEHYLAILRNPDSTSENSLPLKRDRQSDLIESVDTLVSCICFKKFHH